MSIEDSRNIRRVRDEYAEALAWLESLGVRRAADDDRYAHIAGALGSIDRSVPSLAEAWARRDERISVFESRREASDLIRVHQAYGTRDSVELRHRLRRSRGGPGAPEAETADVGDARNMVAELSWGALLEESGFATSVDTGVDVLWTLPLLGGQSLRVACEVKRVHSERKLGDNISKAAEQIERAVEAGVADGGLVVVVVDRLLDRDLYGQIAAGQDEGSIKALVGSRIREFAEAHRDALEGGRGRKGVVGVRLWWRVLAVAEKADRSPVWVEVHQQHHWEYRAIDTGDAVAVAVRGVTPRMRAALPR